MMLGYVTGRVTATYRSSDIAHRLRIDAVHLDGNRRRNGINSDATMPQASTHSNTSMASQTLHHTSPNIHTCRRGWEMRIKFDAVQSPYSLGKIDSESNETIKN